jgi:iron(III) transport system substrate-binding protein
LRSPRVVAYVSADDAVAREVLAACSAETGIEIVPVFDTEATKSTGLENRLRAERDRPRADLFWSSEGFATARLASDGVLSPMSEAACAGIDPARRDPARRWIAFAARARVVVWNPSKVTAPPTNWWNLPESARDAGGGSIAIADPRFGTTRGHLAALREAWRTHPPTGLAGGGLSPAVSAATAETSPASGAAPDALDAWIDRLVANGVRVLPGGNAATVDAVVAGEALFGLTDSDDALAAIARGLPIAMTLPRTHAEGVAGGGTMLVPNTAGIVRGGPGSDEAAERVVAWLASARCEEILCRSPSRNMPMSASVECDPGFVEADPLRFDALGAQASITEVAARAAARLSKEPVR